MDYSYFSAGPQPYQVFGLPPTPATTHTPQPEDYGNGSPPVCTSPKVDKSRLLYLIRHFQDQYDAQFQAFDPSFRFDSGALGELPQSPTKSLHRNSSISVNGVAEANGNTSNGMAIDNGEEPNRARSSSEEKDNLTPAQSRRKAQNRAALVNLVFYRLDAD
jgi:AP-1-like transcription factor